MKKRLLPLLLSLLLLLCTAPAPAEDAQIEVLTSGDYTYVVLEDGTAEITKYKGKAETLTVPAKLRGYTVTGIGDRAFYACFELEEIEIPPNVTEVEDGAFIECRKLKRASLSPKMDRIPKEMFSHCRRMTEVVIPEGIIKIDEDAFAHCAALRHVTFPDSLETIARGAFFPYPNSPNSLDRETKERIDQLTPKPPPGTRPGRE